MRSEDVARAWAAAVTGTSFVQLRPEELVRFLLGLSDRLCELVRSVPFDPGPARLVGADLVDAHFTDTETLSRSLEVLGEFLPSLVGVPEPPDVPRRLHGVLAALAAGYAAALREATIVEQEAIGRAVLLARHDVEKRLLASETRFRAMFTEAAIGIGIGNLSGEIAEVNPALSRMFGYSRQQFTKLRVSDMVHPDDAPGVWQLYEQLVRGERDHFRTEKRFFRADGAMIWTHLTVSLVRDEHGAPRYQVAMLEDVTERVALQARLEYLAYHDPLTGLPNRALFSQQLAAAFAEPVGRRRIGLCLLDLDGFKGVNDSLGHHIGDQLLVAVAARLSACCGAPRVVARMSGDEFVVLTRDAGIVQLIELAETVLRAMAEPVRVDGHELRISGSIGIVELAAAETTQAELMSLADITLYRAKGEGKGRYAVFDREYTNHEIARIELSSSLPGAIERGEFFLDYQPLVSFSTQWVNGVEALVRWQHPTLGLLGPGEFIGLAEESGAIVALGHWVLAEACAQAHQWAVEFGDRAPFVSVNLAARQLEQPSLVADIAAVLADTGLQPSRLQLELTERAVMRESAGPLDALRALDEMGVRIVIDDFGTGYSNLSYLARLPIHGLKLDGTFITNLGKVPSEDDELVVSMLVALAHGLGLTVTAEGVETAAQRERARALGCDLGQGWLLGRPAPALTIGAALGESPVDRHRERT
jgi:diguanylate cyclase (GGDEF)-like protein/PAS domain S-box-containing protein